jgi:hypothetical protein
VQQARRADRPGQEDEAQGGAGRAHSRRHAPQLLKAGVQPKVVAERLGHAPMGITVATCSQVMPGMQEDAAAKIDAGEGAALAG